MVRAVLKGSAPALVLTVVILLPFLGKAFTIDDTVFLREAEHALVDPLHPTAFDYPWNFEPERLSTIVPTGPVGAWLLVPAVRSGAPEEVAHATMFAFLALAIMATISLAIRLGLCQPWASGSGLLVAACPTVLGMAGTAMPDVPAMALGVAGMERLLAWRRSDRRTDALLAAVLLGLAPLARTQYLVLVPLGALALMEGGAGWAAATRDAARRAWPLAAALGVTLGGAMLTRDPGASAGSLGGAATDLSGLTFVPANVVGYLLHWVLAVPLGLPWLVLRRTAMARRWWLLAVGLAVTALAATGIPGDRVRPLSAMAAALGLAVLVDIAIDAWERRDLIQGALWAWLLVPLPALVYIHFPAKYLLASAPAAAILVARRLPEAGRLARPVLAGAVTLGLLLGVAILRADAAFAGFGRTAAATLIAPRVARGERVWFIGHWGFQWYAEQAGARFFSISPPYPLPGDVVVSSDKCNPQIHVEDLAANLQPIGRIEETSPGGRLMDRRGGAGFYSNSWGYLPWAWSTEELDGFDVFRVVRSR